MCRPILKRVALLAMVFLPLFLHLSAEAQEKRWSTIIARVLDGNTLVATDRAKLRLIDIRLPEAQAARDSLVEYLKEKVEGKKVLLEKDYRERDEDGALLVYVFVDNILLNAEVLANGLATMKRQTVNTRYQEFFFKSQAAAYSAGYGLWGGRAAPAAGEAAGPAPAVREKAALSRPVRYDRVKKDVLLTPEKINNEGVDNAEKGDLESAVARWQEAAQLMPKLYEPRHNLARAKVEKGLYAEAEEIIKGLIEERPKEARLPTLLGMALLGQDKPDAAIEQHKQALSLDPALYEAKLNMARTYESSGDTGRALYEYNRAKTLSPDDPYLYLSIGDLYQAQGDEDKAVENWSRSLELSPDKTFASAVQAKLDALEAEKGLSPEVLSERLFSALVQVQATRVVPDPTSPRARTVRQISTGAGFIINARGEIITSAGLISGATEIAVRVYQPEAGGLVQTPYPAEVVVSRRIPSVTEVPFLDFALIRMTSPPRGLRAMELGSTSGVEAGAAVYTMGYPGSSAHRLIRGSVAEVRDLPGDEKQRIAMLKSHPAIKASPVKKVKLLVTDLGIDEQLRGAPLVSKSGQVIGVNATGLAGYEGQSISLDIDSARSALRR